MAFVTQYHNQLEINQKNKLFALWESAWLYMSRKEWFFYVFLKI